MESPTAGLRPLDALTLGYFVTVGGLVTVFHARVPHWWEFPAGYALATIAILALVRAHGRNPGHRWLTLARWGYPLPLSSVLYTTVNRYVLVLRGHFVDTGMNDWEQRVFGGHPNVAIGVLASRPLTEFLYLCYFGFYLFFLIPPLWLWRKRRDRDLERYVFTLMAALYTCYLGFLAVPLAGPGTSLAGRFHPAVLRGYLVVPLQKFIMAHGDPPGACFPSAHVAGAWSAMLAIRALIGRRAFWYAFPFAAGLTVAVVYTRYHYLSDALAGLTVALVVFALVRRRDWALVAGRTGPVAEPVLPGPATEAA
jgi:hypothetical protein